MPNRTNSLPRLCRDRANNRACVYLNGRRVYVAPWGSNPRKPSRHAQQEYERLIARWVANGRQLIAPATPGEENTLSVNELILAYWRHVQNYYRDAEGNPTSEVGTIKLAMRPLKRLYGNAQAVEFGPLALEGVRRLMIDDALARGTINNHVDRIKRLFKWAAQQELLPGTIYGALRTVDGLREGRTDARETDPVKPVPEAHVDAVLPHVLPPIRAMIELQRLTGMRPGEVTIMRGCDLVTSGEVWAYTPARHKTRHRGKKRFIAIGPKAQDVLKPWLKHDLQAYLFSPSEAVAGWNAERRENRKSPMTPSQAKRRPKPKPKRRAGACYTVPSYRRAIQRACEAAEVPKWFPHQLRHNAATRIRKEYGLEVARAVLGHSTMSTTEIYAEMDQSLVLRIMGEIG